MAEAVRDVRNASSPFGFLRLDACCDLDESSSGPDPLGSGEDRESYSGMACRRATSRPARVGQLGEIAGSAALGAGHVEPQRFAPVDLGCALAWDLRARRLERLLARPNYKTHRRFRAEAQTASPRRTCAALDGRGL
jgi:hypothetical protein